MSFLFSLGQACIMFCSRCRGGCVPTERVVVHFDDIYFASKTRCRGSERSRVVGSRQDPSGLEQETDETPGV